MRALALGTLLILGVASLVYAAADVSVTQYDSEDPVTLGGTITYSIVVMNNGPDPSGNVVLSDTLPANVTFVSANGPDDWSCNTPQKDTAGALNCSNGGLNPTQNASFTVVVKPTALGIVTNTVTVASTEPDPNLENNSKSEETTVTTALQPHEYSSSSKIKSGLIVDTLKATKVWPNH
jgi:uncharacterized repeat protein (TIGR01451 family)